MGNRKRTVAFIMIMLLCLSASFSLGRFSAFAADTVSVAYKLTYDADDSAAMLSAVNAARSSASVSEVAYDSRLEEIAVLRAKEIALYYSHTRPDGSDCKSAFGSTELTGSVGEKIAADASSVEEAVAKWKTEDNGTAAYGKLTDAAFQYVGMGHVACNQVEYWVLEFSEKKPDVSASGTTKTYGSYTAELNRSFISGVGISLLSFYSNPIVLSKGSTLFFSNLFKPYIYTNDGYHSEQKFTATDDIFTYDISKLNTDVVEILTNETDSQTGGQVLTLRAVGAGETAATALSTIAGKSTSLAVQLKVTGGTVSVTSVSLNKTSLNLAVNGSETLTATIKPSNATNRGLTWSSKDTSVASVNNSGLVTGKKAGTTTVTATTADGSYTASCSVTVTDAASQTNTTSASATQTNTSNTNTAQANTNTQTNTSNTNTSQTNTASTNSSQTNTSQTNNAANTTQTNNATNTAQTNTSNTNASDTAQAANSGTSAASGVQSGNGLIEISQAEISNIDYYYNYTGTSITPIPVLYYQGVELNKGSESDFTFSYINNNSVGTASILIKGKGNYTGETIKTFIIRPKKTPLNRVSGKRKQMIVRWRMQIADTDGYQVQFSVHKNMSGAEKKIVPQNHRHSLTIGKLLPGQKYYVRIRTYKIVSGVHYYSAWSRKKTVKIK